MWQVKSGVKVPSATTEFDPDKHGALIKAIKNGSDYVLFWTKDVVDPTRQTVTDKFTQAVGAIRPRAKAHVLFADNIESFCFVHMAILALNPAAPLRGVLTFDRWGLGWQRSSGRSNTSPTTCGRRCLPRSATTSGLKTPR